MTFEPALLNQSTAREADRFEFRVFGASLDPEASVLRAIAGSGRFEAGVDRYVLVPDRLDLGLKLSDGALELKTLEETLDGLERWHPRGRAPFPARGADLEMLAKLKLPQPPAERTFYNASDLCDWLKDQGLCVPCLRKRRRHFLLENAQAEHGEVALRDRHLETLAVESVDAEAVSAALARLGLRGRENTSYPRLLASLA